MELTRTLLRFAAGRPHVLLTEVPGGTAARVAAEAELRRRGWPAASSPAEADMLVLAGPVGTRLTPMVGRLWRQVPKPRAFVHVDSAAAVAEVLDEAGRGLATGGEAWGTFAGEDHHNETHGGSGQSGDDENGHGDESGQDGAADHEGEGTQDDHGGGGGHDHGGGMEMPGGLGMAGRGPDRDGLQLDQLHVPLGPLLPGWPAGLVVHTTLQGDVVQEARVDMLREEGSHTDFWNELRRRAAAGEEVTRGAATRRFAAAYLDGLAGFLRVAGWADPAAGATRLRDELLAGARAEQVTPRLQRLARQLRRARTLRWLTDGLGVLPPARAEAAGFGGTVLRASRCGGDVTARWLAWLTEIESTLPGVDDTAALAAEEALQGPVDENRRSVPALTVLPGLLEGAELAAVRLIVASFEPDICGFGARAAAEVTDV